MSYNAYRHDCAGYTVSIDGGMQVGLVSSFKHPALEMAGEWSAGAGMSAKQFRRFFTLGELKSELTFSDFNRRMASVYGLSGRSLIIRAAMVDQTDATTSVRVTLRGSVNKLDRGEWKQGEKTEEKYEIALSYYRLDANNLVIDEVDPERGVLIIGGNNLRARVNKALGLP
ncbi:phage major tail tube protein [Novispirillum itersonii]|uniref:phage major tail tube protein n=1 Tax=Novispirillum itersonii TaxID=189 RepID=UPI0003726F9C|nr:phage major tail tube protein [Novispirillum itersonii]